jgi:hypothetical protein
MKKYVVIAFALLIISFASAQEKHRVFIFTDINIDSGDPDDRQSLVHLLWYANEVNIEGIVPERWNARSVEACELALEAYSKDYKKYQFKKHGYPKTYVLKKRVAKDTVDVFSMFKAAASDNSSPLYVLIWGNMRMFNRALYKYPEYADNLRIITIGTGNMLEKDIPHLPKSWKKTDLACEQYNWNGFGRSRLYNDEAFKNLWWLEMNWTYNGMFPGEEPKAMFHKLAEYGKMGLHIKEVVKNLAWAQYFRVGDTPSVLYVIDPKHDINNPTFSSWAGKYNKPFPDSRPNYYTDYCGNVDWDYRNPCNTWENHTKVATVAKQTLLDRRDDMYKALLEKLDDLYTK